MERLENKMLLDSLWENIEKSVSETDEKLNGSGWEERKTGIFVPEEDAFDYAMERISQDEDLKQELKEMVLDWFFSGNWIWIKEGDDDNI